jgi:hypothetical protein
VFFSQLSGILGSQEEYSLFAFLSSYHPQENSQSCGRHTAEWTLKIVAALTFKEELVPPPHHSLLNLPTWSCCSQIIWQFYINFKHLSIRTLKLH